MPDQRVIRRIKRLYMIHQSYAEVARITKISKTTVYRIVKNINQKTGKKLGRPCKIDRRTETRIKKFVSGKIMNGHFVNAVEVKRSLHLTVSVSTIQRKLNELGFKYQKVVKELPLSRKNKRDRFNNVKDWMLHNVNFNEVVFTDEKRFSLDGPDGFYSYVDKRARKVQIPTRKKRQQGGGSVMIWGCVTSDGEILIKFIDGKYKAKDYLRDLQFEIIPRLDAKFGKKKYYFQQDNCSVHKAEIVMRYLEANVKVLSFPARSPDLNIIENVWKMIQDIVYRERQFENKGQLKLAIIRAIEIIKDEKQNEISNLYASMQNRMNQVILFKGNQTQY